MSEIPTPWINAPLGQVATLQNGFAFKSSNYVKQGHFVIRIGNVQDGEIALTNPVYVDASDSKTENFVLKADDLLMSLTGNVGRVAFIKPSHLPAVLNQRVARLYPDSEDGVIRCFLFYFLQTPVAKEYLLGVAKGAAQLNISGKDVLALNFTLPPLAEQKEIALRLDDLLAQVDSIKTRLDNLPSILKRFRQSTLAAAVSGKLTEEWREENHAEQWRASTMGEAFKCIDGDRGPNYPKKAEYKSEGHCLFLSTKNVREFGFNFSDQVFLDQEKHEKLRNGTLSRGDLIITTRGTLGYVASYDDSVPFDVVRINSGMLILRKTNADFVNDFFKCVIAAPQFQKMIDERRTGSAQPQLPAKILKQFELTIPSVPEQTEIVRRVEELFVFSDQVEQRMKDAQAHVNHLTQSILAKAFRGELTESWRANNPSLITGENSAAELLKRIKSEREKLASKKKTRKKKVL